MFKFQCETACLFMWLRSGPEESTQTLQLACAAKHWTAEEENSKINLAEAVSQNPTLPTVKVPEYGRGF